MFDIKYSNLFEPIKIGKVEIKNRIAMAPMGTFGMVTLQGGFSQRAVDYYVERARGGTGLIITTLVRIEQDLETGRTPPEPNLSINPIHFIQCASELTERAHAYGAKIFIMLTGGFGRVIHLQGMKSQPVAPSAIPNYWDPSIICRELRMEEVEKLVKQFGQAAEIVAHAGFDGIEIHAVHEGYLIDQFTIAMFNRRTDKYGGDLKGRLTLPIEIVKEIKNAVGAEFPVALRYSIKSYIKDWNQGGLPGEEFKEMGRDVAEGLEAAQILEEAGYDAFDADVGSYDGWYWAHPPHYQKHGCYLPLTARLKQVIKVPVIVAGRMEIPNIASIALAQQQADMVGLGRGLLAEPYWPKKILEGRINSLRPCLGCHDGCMGRGTAGQRPLSCAVNPSCGREKQYGIYPALKSKNILVVGGGVAGMEAARVAAMRGHEVSLYEKTDKLGGHLIEASVPSFKEDVARLLKWYQYELFELGVEVNLNHFITMEEAIKQQSEALIVATGSGWIIPEIKNINASNVLSASEALLGKKSINEPVTIIGGGLTGCETALWLAQQGKDVTIVEMMDELMTGGIPVPHMNRIMLLDLLVYNKVKVLTSNRPVEIKDKAIVLLDKQLSRSIMKANTIVVATGLKSENIFPPALSSTLANIFIIGDARQPGNIMSGIWDAYEIANSI